jgi:hypothetical protein
MAGIYLSLRLQNSPEAKSAQSVSVTFLWGQSKKRKKLTSYSQSALIVRICGVLILIPHSF